eukprot:CAMPEP_0196672000 /NCGR_PEP_ID=MMETSP1090-20130531/2154_1 /TAXON_ID=37098 /ORGANISM="Isochrysis sp, Strain CCMP1244" /LENGTH=48 /DNA_ID= /DNA_START= /DNA_END= /DNA_ORIENTATION=
MWRAHQLGTGLWGGPASGAAFSIGRHQTAQLKGAGGGRFVLRDSRHLR